MAVDIRSSHLGSASNGTATATLGSGTEAGDLLVLWRTDDYNPDADTDFNPSGGSAAWTLVGARIDTIGGDTGSMWCYWGVAAAGGSADVTCHTEDEGDNQLVVYVLTGADTSDPIADFDSFSTGPSTGVLTDYPVPSLDVAADGSMVLTGIAPSLKQDTITQPSGFTLDHDKIVDAGNWRYTSWAHLAFDQGATGALTWSAGTGSTRYTIVAGVVINPASGGGGPIVAPLGMATVEESGLTFARARTRPLSTSLSAESALGLARAHTRALGTSGVVEAALDFARTRVRGLAMVMVVEEALSLSSPGGGPLGLAEVNDAALDIVRSRRRTLPVASLIDEALSFARARKLTIALVRESALKLAGASTPGDGGIDVRYSLGEPEHAVVTGEPEVWLSSETPDSAWTIYPPEV